MKTNMRHRLIPSHLSLIEKKKRHLWAGYKKSYMTRIQKKENQGLSRGNFNMIQMEYTWKIIQHIYMKWLSTHTTKRTVADQVVTSQQSFLILQSVRKLCLFSASNRTRQQPVKITLNCSCCIRSKTSVSNTLLWSLMANSYTP